MIMDLDFIIFLFSLAYGIFSLKKWREKKNIKTIIIINIFLLVIIAIQYILYSKCKISIVGQRDAIFYVLFLSTGIIMFLVVKKLKKNWLIIIYSGFILFLSPIFLLLLAFTKLPTETMFVSKNIELREKRYILGGDNHLVIVKENFIFEREILISEKNYETQSINDKAISPNESKLIFLASEKMSKTRRLIEDAKGR
jgi:hypothetical protein